MAEKKLSVGEFLLVVATVLAAVPLVLSDLTKEWPTLGRWSLFAVLVLFLAAWAYYYFYALGGSDGESADQAKAERISSFGKA